VNVVGIVAAMPEEAKCLIQSAGIANKSLPAAGNIQISENAILCLSGIGADAAQAAASTLLQNGVTALLSWGCAGGLDSMATPGTLILPDKIIHAPTNTSEIKTFNVDADWHHQLRHMLSPRMPINTSALVSSASMLADTESKTALREKTGGIAVDMESATIAALAHHHRIPFMAIRAIADAADTSIPEEICRAMNQHGHITRANRIGLALRPWMWLRLARLNQQYTSAIHTLSNAADILSPARFAPPIE